MNFYPAQPFYNPAVFPRPMPARPVIGPGGRVVSLPPDENDTNLLAKALMEGTMMWPRLAVEKRGQDVSLQRARETGRAAIARDLLYNLERNAPAVPVEQQPKYSATVEEAARALGIAQKLRLPSGIDYIQTRREGPLSNAELTTMSAEQLLESGALSDFLDLFSSHSYVMSSPAVRERAQQKFSEWHKRYLRDFARLLTFENPEDRAREMRDNPELASSMALAARFDLPTFDSHGDKVQGHGPDIEYLTGKRKAKKKEEPEEEQVSSVDDFILKALGSE